MNASRPWIWILLVVGLASPASPERLPKEGPQDPRIRTIYNPRDVVRIVPTSAGRTRSPSESQRNARLLVVSGIGSGLKPLAIAGRSTR